MQGLSEFLCYIFVHCSLQNHEACLKKHVVGRPGIWLIISSAWEMLGVIDEEILHCCPA